MARGTWKMITVKTPYSIFVIIDRYPVRGFVRVAAEINLLILGVQGLTV